MVHELLLCIFKIFTSFSDSLWLRHWLALTVFSNVLYIYHLYPSFR